MAKPFFEKVYAIVKQIPKGRVATYQDIAILAGSPKAVRAVGSAMKNNPDPARIPCHRVVGSNGAMHGYAFGGVITKKELLQKEGVRFKNDRADLSSARWKRI